MMLEYKYARTKQKDKVKLTWHHEVYFIIKHKYCT